MHEKILELARRRLASPQAPRPLDLLRGPATPPTTTGLPEVWNQGIRTFYEMLDDGAAPRRCSGTACRYARGELAPRGGPASGNGAALPPVRCLGRCFEGPADEASPSRFIPRRALTATPVVLRHLLAGAAPAESSATWSDYDLPSGDCILASIEAWGLRGRGGAAYPTAAKWKAARDTPASDRIVVANGDEGDPGAYVDRLLLEEAPHSVLAGMLACARVIGASRGIVYIRAEYPGAATRMRSAITDARARRMLAGFDVEVLVGAGSYVAGEETALLRSIEGLRAEPHPKPPYPAVRGLFGLPTVVQNVETLSIVPYIARPHRGRVDTKAVCLSGAVARPGIVEVDLGTPLRRVLDEGGGGAAAGRRWKMALVGGPLGRIVPDASFDVPLSFDALPGMGHAGIVVFDDAVGVRALAEHLFDFARGESCGTCAPCRIGTAQLASRRTRGSLERLLATIGDGSLCGFGQGVPRPILDLLAAYGDEVLRVKLCIDGADVVVTGATLLDACRGAGADVPTLCHDDRVTAGGHCRACMVEMDGRLVPACTTPARDGAVIATTSERVREYRRDLGELMMAEASPRGRARDLLWDWGVGGTRYPAIEGRHGARDASHAFLRIDLDACIRCRLCVAACADIQGQFVWAVVGRGTGTRVAWGPGAASFTASDCVGCGACASLCPTGAVSDIDREREIAIGGDARVVRTTCSYCGVGCALDVHAIGDDIVRIDGARSSVNDGHLCVKGRYAHRFARHPDRVRTPLIRRDGKLQPATWDEALEMVAREMMRLRGHVGGLSSSRCTNEENYLLQKWMRAGLGTNNVDCCARVCHAPSAAGMRLSLGTGAATNSLADIERADLLLVAGSNTTASHPVIGARVKQAVLAGAVLVVIDPRRTELAAFADIHLQPRPGTNVPLLNSMAAVLVEEGFVDRGFVEARTEGFRELAAFLRGFAPERTEETTGVPAALVRDAARLYGRAETPMQMHGLGITEHLQGSEGVRLLCNLALLRGAIGRDGVGVNPLRGQNNVQGAADMGCQPDLLPGYASVADASVRQRFAAEWKTPLPDQAGLTLPRMYEAIDRGEIRGLFVLGEDVVQTDPDSDRVRERLAALEFLVVQEIFLSETASLAHVVLPGASAFEKDGTFTNGERRVQRVRRVLDPIEGSRADWGILADLMRRCGMKEASAHPREIFDEIRRLWPGVAAADYEALDRDGLQWPVTAQAPAGTAILHRDGFSRGRAELACVPFVASEALGGGPLTLITGRVLEHYNSGSMTRRSGASALVPWDELEIHPGDALARGIADGDRVSVSSEFGEALAAARVTMDVSAGTVFLSFHFPETGTNRVTSDVEDRLTGCPEYKVTAVEVAKVELDLQSRA